MLEMASFFLYLDIYIKIIQVMVSDNRISEIINEEINKTEVDSIVSNRLSSSYNTREFKRAVKDITAEVIEDLFRTLWNRSSTWKGGVTR